VSVLLSCFSQLGERDLITVFFIVIAVNNPILDLFWLPTAEVVMRIFERDALD